MRRAKIPNVAFENWRSRNVTLHLNKKHVSFQVERSQEVLKTILVVTTKENSRAELKQTFWNVLNIVLESWCFSFGEIAQNFSESMYENHQNNCTQYKTMKTTFSKKSKAVFISIRYRKTSQPQVVKRQSTKRSLQELAQPKRDSAFEQKRRIVSCKEISASSENSFFIYNQKIKPSRAQKDISGTYSTSFWKFSILLKQQMLFF